MPMPCSVRLTYRCTPRSYGRCSSTACPALLAYSIRNAVECERCRGLAAVGSHRNSRATLSYHAGGTPGAAGRGRSDRETWPSTEALQAYRALAARRIAGAAVRTGARRHGRRRSARATCPTVTAGSRSRARGSGVAMVPVFLHAAAHRGIRQPATAGGLIVDEMRELGGVGNRAGDRRVRDHVLEEVLCPARDVDVDNPGRQRAAGRLAEQRGTAEG